MPFSRYPSGSCPCQVSLPFELRHFPAGSLSPLSRIEFVSYRLVVLLRLLPTPPHDDAVAVEYGPENVCPVGTFTLLFKCAYERTSIRASPFPSRAESSSSPTDRLEYGPENVCPVGTFTLLFKCAYERTRSRLRAANLIFELSTIQLSVNCNPTLSARADRTTLEGPFEASTPGMSRVGKEIGVGKAHWFEPPLPPNRTCGSPASGSPVSGVHGGTDRSARGLRPW